MATWRSDPLTAVVAVAIGWPVQSVEDALRVGNMLVSAGVVEHVTKGHKFKVRAARQHDSASLVCTVPNH